MVLLRLALLSISLIVLSPLGAVADNVYTVRKGDTLSKLAKRFHTTIGALKKVNGLKSDRLYAGEEIALPDTGSSAVTHVVTHRVVSGDTLSKISYKHKVSVDDLMTLNNLRTTRLLVGQKLRIAKIGAAQTTASVNVCNGLNNGGSAPLYRVHTIKRGDTLGKLSARFGVSIGEMKRINGLKSNMIVAGKVIYFPLSGSNGSGTGGPDSSGGVIKASRNYPSIATHIVKRGDTLGRIAKKHGSTVKDLKRANGLKGHIIRPGQRLIVPVDRGVVARCGSSAPWLSAGHAGSGKPVIVRHVVKKGETLGRISKKYRVSVKTIKSANKIKGSLIRTGQKLDIPTTDVLTAEAAGGTVVRPSLVPDSIDIGKLIKENGLIGESVVKIAKTFIGSPYKFGGTSFITGIDCSAYVSKVFRFFEVKLPRTAREIFKVGLKVDKSDLQIADLIFFRTYAKYPSHVGIYIGNNKFIHASSRARGVTISSIEERYFRKRYIGARRVAGSIKKYF